MYYIHYDNNGRPDMFSGYKYKSFDKAVEKCKELRIRAYVCKEIDIIGVFTGKPAKGFSKTLFCNDK